MYKQEFQHDWNGLGWQYTQLKLSSLIFNVFQFYRSTKTLRGL